MMKNSSFGWLWKPSSGKDINTTNLPKSTIEAIVSRYKTADPFFIVDQLNIDWYYMPLGKHSLGDTSYDDHQPIIILNESIHHSPQRYSTLTHEIGHVVMHADRVGYHSGMPATGFVSIRQMNLLVD